MIKKVLSPSKRGEGGQLPIDAISPPPPPSTFFDSNDQLLNASVGSDRNHFGWRYAFIKQRGEGGGVEPVRARWAPAFLAYYNGDRGMAMDGDLNGDIGGSYEW